MKKETNKKSKLWIWLAVGIVAVLAVVGVILALLPGGQSNPGTTGGKAELYWNVDRLVYMENAKVEGFSERPAAEDGNYYITFAYEGQQVELQIIDKQLVNIIDNMDVMGLLFDADGVVIDAVDPTTVATETAKGAFIQKVEDGCITVNTSQAMNGMTIELPITENTGIYDVTTQAELVGQPGTPDIMDQVVAYADENGEITHIYITAHPVDAGVYWRVERMYDAETPGTTRVPDENGVYTIQFAHNGELVDVKCKDRSIVDNIDSKALLQGQFACLFDDEGYLIECVNVALSLRGTYLATDYHVTAIEGDTYTLTKLSTGNEQGRSLTMTLAEDCEIFQCCQWECFEHNCGEYTDHLNLYDRVNVYANLDGEAIMIFVTRRMIHDGNLDLYFNYDRQYGGDATGTMRKPVNGYYVFQMLLDGKVKTVRVKDKAMADAIDKPYNKSVGLVVEGDIVTKVYDPSCVVGGPNYANEIPVAMLSGPMVTFNYTNGTTRNFVMSGDCKVYNAITGEYGKDVGGEMTLQQGDVVVAFTDYKDELALVYIVSRPVQGAKVYYNLSRRYDSTKRETTREPNADGYYEFQFACEGKQVTGKTKSKGMATFIDSQSAPVVGLKINSSGIITNAYVATAAVANSAKVCNYHYVKDLNTKEKTFGTYYIIDDVRTDSTAVQKIADNCAIYNVSTSFENFRGEKATLKNGDQIQGIKDSKTGEVIMIFIMQRDPTYGFKSYKANCAHCNKNVTWEPYGGNIAVADGHYYACGNFTLKQGNAGAKDDGKIFDIVLDLKGYSITSTGRAFLVYDRLTILDSKGGGKVAGTTPSGDTATIGSTIMVMEGGELNLMGGTLTLSENSTKFGTLGGVVYVQPKATMNMSGGTITGGTSDNGGNVYVGGTFNLSGGTISGGNAPMGQNISVASTGTLNISGGNVDGGIYMGNGAVTLSGKPVIGGTGLAVTPGKQISVKGLTDGASVVIAGNGVFTEELTNPESYLAYFKAAAEGDSISVKGAALDYYKKPADYNSVDNSNLKFAAGTTNAYCSVCEKTVTWTALKADKLTMNNGHYYLASDLTYVGDKDNWFLTAPGTGKTACLHLNGHNITCTNNRVVQGSTGTLNILGNGTVTGGWKTGSWIQAGTVGINTSGASGTINLVGGTYVTTAADTPVVAITDNGGTINMYNGATVRGSGSGSVVHIGKATLVNANFNVYGGSIEGGVINMTGAQNDKGNTATLTVAGGKIPGGVTVGANSQVVLQGSPEIGEMSIPKGVLLDAKALTTGASITVRANGVFTEKLTDADTVKTYFTPASSDDEIIVQDGALVYAAKKPEGGLVLDENGYGMCEHCGENVQWTEITGGLGTVTDTTKHHHYYLSGNLTFGGSALMSVNGKAEVCLHLNGYTVTQKGWINVIQGTLSILNGTATTGGIVGTHDTYNTFNISWGTLNIYGGTYSYAGTADLSTIQLGQNSSRLNLYGGKIVSGIDVNKGVLTLSKTAAVTGAENELTDNIYVAAAGKLTVKSNYTGTASVKFENALTDNAVPAENGSAEGGFTGKLYLEADNSPELVGDGAKLIIAGTGSGGEEEEPTGGIELDDNGYAMCEHCGESVKWTALYSHLGSNFATGDHYYLADDITTDSQFATVTGGKTLCIHLNGKDLSIKSRIYVSQATLSIMGEGSVTTTGTTSANEGALVAKWGGTNINLYGGTYTTTNTNAMPVIKTAGSATATINVYEGVVIEGTGNNLGILLDNGTLNLNGGTVHGGIYAAKGAVNLSSAATATGKNGELTGNIGIASAAKLVVKADYTGTASVLFESALTDNTVPAANGACEGAFTGKLYLDAENSPELVGEGTKLVLKSAAGEEPSGVLELDDNGYAMCEHCGESVKWTALYSHLGSNFATGDHYYLADDITTDSQFATVGKDQILCIHLNGKDLSIKSRIYVSQGTLNIMGEGSVTTTGTTRANEGGLVAKWGGTTINLYGGTYTTTNTNAMPVIKAAGSATAVINVYEGAVVEGTATSKAIDLDKATLNLNGGTVYGGITTVNAASVNLSGAATATGKNGELSGNISICAAAKLNVKSDYTGIACVDFESPLVNNVVPAVNGTCEGEFSGKLYKEQEGGAEFISNGINLVLTGGSGILLDEDGYAVCRHCNEKVKWTALSTVPGTNFETGAHYYLADNITTEYQFATVMDGKTLCIHLNGKNLSIKSRIYVQAATLSIMGGGTVTTTGTTSTNEAGLVAKWGGSTINLYGGTYTTTNINGMPVIKAAGSKTAVINVYEGVVIEGSQDNRAVLVNNGALNLHGGAVYGGVDVAKGTLSLSGAATVTGKNGELTGNISIASGAMLNVYNDWSGDASVAWAQTHEKDDVIDAAAGQCGALADGVFTAGGSYDGRLTEETSGRYINGQDGALVVGETKQEIEDKTLKVLIIGNSFGWDSMYLLYDVYMAENPEKDVELAFLHLGGCSLATHVTNLTQNKAVYSYYKINSEIYADTGKWKLTEKTTMLQGLKDECWDIVSLQQASANTPNPDSYNSDIGTIRDYVTANLGYTPEFAWNLTWAYPDDAELLSTNSDVNFASNFFANYGTSANMYAQIRDAVEKKIVNGEYAWDHVMPSGTAIQNARQSLTAKELYRDSLHMSDLGRLIVAYTWYCELEGYNGADKALTELKLTKIPAELVVSNGVTELDDTLEQIVIEAVNNALKNKLAVTQ